MIKNLYIIPAFVLALSVSAHAKTTTVSTPTAPEIHNSVSFMPVPNCDPSGSDHCPCPFTGHPNCVAQSSFVSTSLVADKPKELAAVSLWAWFFDYRVDPSNTGGVTGSW
jgi:hypothetical protein